MKRLIFALMTLCVVAQVGAIDKYSVSQTFSDGKVLSASDLNGIEAQIKTWINSQLLQGSTHVTIAAGDTLIVNGRLVVDSLRATGLIILESSIRPSNDRLYDIGSSTNRIDTLWIHNIDAAKVESDSVATDSLTSVSKTVLLGDLFINALAGSHSSVRVDTVAVGDSLTVTGPVTFTGAFTASGGGAFTGTWTSLTLSGLAQITQTTGFATLKADSLEFSMPDSTFDEASYKTEFFSLLDGRWLVANGQSGIGAYWAMSAGARGTSWWRDEGYFPMVGDIVITTGQDSLLIRDLMKSPIDTVMAFATGANTYLGASNLNDVAFQNMQIFVATAGSGVQLIDLMRDYGYTYQTSGLYGNTVPVTGRQSTTAFLLNAAPAITHNTVNAVEVHWDQQGTVEERGGVTFGKPVLYVGTSSNLSVSDPGIAAFYDSGVGGPPPHAEAKITKDFVWALDVQANGILRAFPAAPTITADGYSSEFGYASGSAGANDVPFIPTYTAQTATALRDAGLYNSDVAVFGSTKGVIVSHVEKNDPTNSLTIAVGTNHNIAYRDTNMVFDFSEAGGRQPFQTGFTNVNGATFGDGKIGLAVTGDGVDQYLVHKHVLGGYRIWATADKGTYAFWAKSTSATNPVAQENVIQFSNFNGAADENTLVFYFNTSGQMSVTVYDGADVTSTFAQDTYDGNWHHYAWTWDGTTQNLWVDGVIVDSDAMAATQAINCDSIFVMAGSPGGGALGGYFAGSVDNGHGFSEPLSANEIRFLVDRGNRARGDRRDYLGAADVDYSHADDGGGVISFGNQDTLYTTTKAVMPLERVASPGGNILYAEVYAQGDSLAHYLSTSTKTRIFQPDPGAMELANDQGPTFAKPYIVTNRIGAASDSGIVIEASLRITPADSADAFQDTDPGTKGTVQIGADLEVRGPAYGQSWGTVTGHGIEYVEVGSNEFRRASSVEDPATPTRLPQFARAIRSTPRISIMDTVIVADDDSSRTFTIVAPTRRADDVWARPIVKMRGFGGREFRHFRSKRYKGDGTTTIERDVTDVYVPEAGDSVRIGNLIPQTLPAAFATVSEVTESYITLSVAAPADSFICITPPSIQVAYTECLVSPGNILHVRPSGLYGRININGAVGWVVPTTPGGIILNRKELRTADNVLPIMVVGWDYATVDATVAISAGDPLKAATLGKLVKAAWTDVNILAIALEAKASGVGNIKVRKP